MNTFRENKEQLPQESRGSRFMGNVARILAAVLGGSILTRENVLRSLPFLFYLMFLGLMYIGNTYYAERTLMKSHELRKELRELRYAFVSGRSQLMNESKQTEVARRLEERGLQESRVPPVKITLTEEE